MLQMRGKPRNHNQKNEVNIMILADKIIKLRKKNGWSQEELAEKMNVSRQAVSKWESAQTVPDLEKILQLGNLFGVSTDYLLKDEMEDEEFIETPSDVTVRRITVEDANRYLEERGRASWKIALATFLCILSPVALIYLGAASDAPNAWISEAMATTVGLGVLFLFVLCAVPLYIYCGFKNQPFEFLEKNEPFELSYGVKGIVTERQKAFRNTYVFSNIIATCLCIVSPLPLILTSFLGDDMLSVAMLALLLLLVGIAVSLFIIVGVRQAAMQKLLCEGEYSVKNKMREEIESVYWGLVVAIYLLVSYLTHAWHVTWVIFPLAGALSSVVVHFFESKMKNHSKKD